MWVGDIKEQFGQVDEKLEKEIKINLNDACMIKCRY